MEKSRFSMLLLEPGEIYFEDFSCTMSNTLAFVKENCLPGRLKLCSKSLVFESREFIEPLIKLHFKDCIDICIVEPTKSDQSQNIIKINVQQYVHMLAENILAPYKFVYAPEVFYFFLDFANAEECLIQMQQLQRASTLHAPEHNSMVATILHSRYMRMVFDPCMMDDFTEQIKLELPVEKISPLVRHQGKIALTESTLYFQPFNNIEIAPILKLKLNQIKRMYKRRFLQRQVGLEIYNEEYCTVPHIYLTFQSTKHRDTLYKTIENSPCVNLEKVMIEEITLQWQNGIVSNYDYLIYLNCLADRSKNDLTQYPVFPWVIANYTSRTLDLNDSRTFRDLSKPMGALNPDRLEKLVERYNEMAEPKFLYGSHYSAPGLVLFYLVRKYPQYMLCLQNGRFDHPDRMFNTMTDVYNNCLKNMSDFKELVPEFYDVEAKGDFLTNKYNIDFGERHDGTKVSNVSLPPWSSSPEDCVQKLRDALESEYVSRYLHLWIDLIFGYKQRGEEAVKANNVFYHVCYEGSVDLDCVMDMNDRHALEVQIMEFGQVPKQLFTRPHVQRITHQIEKPLQIIDKCIPYKLECLDTIKLHREEVTCAILNGRRVISVGKDGTLKVYDMEQKKQIRSVVLCATPLSSCVVIDENVVACGSWNNDIYLYDVEYGRVIESYRAHDDSVSCLLWIPKEKLLISGGWDCVVRVWGAVRGTGPAWRGLRSEFDHDGKVATITYRQRLYVDIIAGTSDGEVCIWRLSTRQLVGRVSVHGSNITSSCYTTAGERVVTAAEDGQVAVTDLNLSHSVFQKNLAETVTSLCWDGKNVLWLGGREGTMLQWNMHAVTQFKNEKIHDGTINSCFYYPLSDGDTMVTCSADKSVKIWKLLQSA